MFLEICWRDNSHIEFSSCQMCSACGFSLPPSSALHPVGMIRLNSKRNCNMILCSEMRLPVLSCCFCDGRDVNVHVLIFYDWRSSHNTAISMVKGYVFQPYGCANPSGQQFSTILEYQTATGAAICWMEKNSLVLSGRRTHTNLTAVISLRCASAAGKCLTSCQGCKSKP